MATKPEIITSLELWQCLNSNAKFGIFDDDELDKRLATWLRERSSANISISGLDGHIAISGYPSMSHLFVELSSLEFGVQVRGRQLCLLR